MPNNKHTVFLLAGNRLLRETLARILRKKGDFKVCEASPSLPDSISLIVASEADVLILDSVSGLPNLTFISEIVAQIPSLKIVLIDMDCDPDVFLECVRVGAIGYILKDASATEVLSGVLAVANGQAVCPPELYVHLFRAVSRQWMPGPSLRIKREFGLTRRQQQLVPLIGQGLTNKEIASQLYLSENTVKNHVHGIMRRVGARDRLEVVEQTRC